MKYSVEVLKIASDPRTTLDEKAPKVKDLLEKAISSFNLYLFFIEDLLKEILEKVV